MEQNVATVCARANNLTVALISTAGSSVDLYALCSKKLGELGPQPSNQPSEQGPRPFL